MRKISLFLLSLILIVSFNIYAIDYSDNFEDGNIDGWQAETNGGRDANGTMAITTESAYGGIYSMKITTTVNISGYDYAAVWQIPVNVGDSISGSAWLKWTAPDGNGLRIWGSWRNPDGSYLSSASGPSTYVNGDWTQQTFSFGTAPIGTGFFQFEIRTYASTALPAIGYADDVLVQGSTSVPAGVYYWEFQ